MMFWLLRNTDTCKCNGHNWVMKIKRHMMPKNITLVCPLILGLCFSQLSYGQDLTLACIGTKRLLALVQGATPEQVIDNSSATYVFKGGQVADAGEIVYSPTGKQKKFYLGCRWTEEKIICDNFDEQGSKCLTPNNQAMCMNRLEISRVNGLVDDAYTLNLVSDTHGKISRTDIFRGKCDVVRGKKF
jgi:hypothetical protein